MPRRSAKNVYDTSRGRCGECVCCEPVMLFHTLTVDCKEPTLGRCKWVDNRCVLLSERGCRRWKKKE